MNITLNTDDNGVTTVNTSVENMLAMVPSFITPYSKFRELSKQSCLYMPYRIYYQKTFNFSMITT